jgi:uncharacterized protein
MSQGELPAENAILAELIEPAAPVPPKPWGFWATMGFSLAVFVVFVAIETAIGVAFVVLHAPELHHSEELGSNGMLLWVATWIANPACLALIVLLVKLRKRLSIRDYLGLNPLSALSFLGWAALMLLFIAISDGTTWLLGRPVVCDFMIDAYRTAVFVPMLLASLWIAAPVFEEVFMRGFMFRGIQQSRLGTIGAVLITALIWAVIHMQYDAYEVAVIFLGGILLGIARAKSNSVYLTMGLHSMMNVVATIELWVYLALQP